MELYSIIFGAFHIAIILQIVKADIPGCHFLETVNISNQTPQNGSYIYQNLEVPVNLTGEYNYITTEGNLTSPEKSHLRGCVCQLKPCLWFCCRFKDWVESHGECTDGLMEKLIGINLNVTLSNGSVVKRNLLSDFIVLRDLMRLYDSWEEDEYTLFENGSVLLMRYMDDTMKFRGYDCLHPNQFSSGNTESIVVAFHIGNFKEVPLSAGATTIIWLSEAFLILTIAVYLYEKKLRNLHGKCFICYMISTCMYFLHLILSSSQIPLQSCVLFGYSFVFFTLTKFTWLLALSHQLWRGLASVNRVASEYSFRAYSIFAWGTAAILTGLPYLIDQIWDGDPSKFKWISRMGWDSCTSIQFKDILRFTCWYPFNIIVALNTTLFVLTAINIMNVKISLKCSSDQGERARNLKSRIQMFQMVLRLLVVMDLQWSLRFTYVFTTWELLLKICKYFDYCIGIIIFVLFILKRSTIRFLMESIRRITAD